MTEPTPRRSEEADRLAKLRELLIMDSPPEPVFDTLARMACDVCGVPIALVSLVDEERQWFKANVGLPGVNETPRDIAFCAQLEPLADVFEVPDTTLDPRFADNPLVTGTPNVRFYAGAALTLPGGQRVGTLCVVDRKAHRLSDAQKQMLQSLAALTSQALTMRRELITKALSVRTQYEQALAESEARYRTLVEEQIELVALSRASGELLYINPACARHFGRKPEEVIGVSLFKFIPKPYREAVRGRIADTMRTGEIMASENLMTAADGSEHWLAWTSRPRRDASGELVLHSVGRDITERKHAERAARASQAFLERTRRVAGVGGWELNLTTRKATWSDETRRIHDVPEDYVPTIEAGMQFYAPEARPLVQAAVERCIEKGEPWDLEVPFITATGRRIWVRVVGELTVKDGRPSRLVGAFQDVTARKLLEQRLTDNERFVRQITDGLPLRIAYVDAQRRYRFVNLPHCQRFGRSRDEILGHTEAELSPGQVDPALAARFDAALAGQAQRFEFSETVTNTTRRMETQLIPDIGDDGDVRGVFSTSIDITERTAAEETLRELTSIFDNTTDYVTQTTGRGAMIYMNPAVRKALGLKPGDPISHHNFTEFNTPATNDLYLQVIIPTIKAHGVWLGETTVYLAGKRVVPISHMVIAHRDSTGRIDRYSSVMRDISADVEAKRELHRQTATLRSVTEAIPAIISVVGADGRYRFVNTSFERWSGAKREQIIGRTLGEVMGRADYERSRPWVERALTGETISFEKDYPDRNNAMHLAISYIPLWLDNGTVDGFVSVAQDITQHKQEEVRLLQLAQGDALTGLLNRSGFEQQLEHKLQGGDGPSLALLYIDLDHFKPVNDRHGHPVGDQVLQMFGERLRKLVRPTDAVARLGGDEFAILLSGVRRSANAHTVADKVIDAARAPFKVGSLTLNIGASVGVAYGADPVTGWRDLIARADAMLYRAKEAGRGRQAGAAD